MKRILAVLLAAVLVMVTFAACGSNDNKTGPGNTDDGQTSSTVDTGTDQQDTDLLTLIQNRGEIVVAMEGAWAPWTYHDESDELVGFDTDVAKAIAAKLGVEAKFVEGDWDGLFAGLESGRYDMIANGVDVTPERAETYDFTDPYAYTRTALVVRADNEDITSFEDLDGKTTANSVGSTYMELAEQYGATVTGVDTLDETIQVVLQGRVDATLNADVSFFDYLGQHPDAEIKIVAETEEANAIAIPLRKGDETATLRAAINQAIKELREEGVLSELSIKYFGSDISE